ncbi:PREDICTED: uncharacterized protein LOC109581645 [Amphimedon queenslandica]|uniref:Uncharacterized protein n=1 Tax=Amphimedon queenslandica TaxID=400682 RepID=A0AAN0J412_AMPQE|nr:PREDICTED: uncharacterized protein LOC109581645 [Amphimedon queenslandica]|eukprot:XP_019851492.1 PREDICTED: uncharacterized protein LOC109581645 [Amphimedon queenslandica]
MATEDTPLYFHDGDIIQLYCPLESGYVYSEPNSTSDLDLSIVSKEKIKVADFAAFSITLKKESENKEKHSSSKEKAKSEETEKIAYGSVICVKHQASDKFLIANDENEVKLSSSDDAKSLFRVVSPNHELEWGNLLKDNDPIKLECNRSSLFVNFNYVQKRKCYKPTLKANGTVFDVQMYCHKQNSKSIKGGSPIIISTLLNIEGYLCATGSFFSSKIDEIESTRPLEEPSASYGRSLEEPTEQQSGIEQQSRIEQPDEQPKYSLTKEGHGKEGMKVDLCKFMEGSFKKLPEYGDAFFQLERVSGPFGSPILFGEECRIKQLFSFKYLAIKSSPAQKVVLCDFNEENESNVIFKVLSVSGSIDHEEVCDFDKVTFQHVKSSKYLSVDLRIRHGQGKRFDLTANEDSGVLQSQFKVLQVKKYLLMDSYYALGLSSFLYDSYIMLQDKGETLVPMCVIQNEIEKKMI